MNLTPDFKTFCSLARKGNLVAVSASVPADLETPVSAYLKLADMEKYSFLLESAEQGEKIGRYSFIGLTPERIFVSKQKKVEVLSPAKKKKKKREGLLADILEQEMSQYRLANVEDLPAFCGGFVGFIGYESVTEYETIRLVPKPGPAVPDALFFLAKEFLVFDHFRKNLSVVVLKDIPKKANLKAIYQNAQKKIQRYLAKLNQPLRMPRAKNAASRPPQMHSNMTRSEFRKKIEAIKEYIRAGDCIQVVFSQRFRLDHTADDFKIYRALRSINPSPYMFYFRAGDLRLIGSSPEMLVKKTGRLAEVRPIAGTRPRGKTPSEDLKMEESLKSSIKENAEHLMLVDLGRNDIGRVCSFNTVQVKNYGRVERYSHVMHLVSDVQGILKPGKTSIDLLKAVFPAGTLSGAPKIRAMEIINELEPENRGAYAGSLGYFSFNHDMDMCITIRTLVNDGRHLYLQAGAGIVNDSNPDREYEETVNKAKALFRAIERQGEF